MTVRTALDHFTPDEQTQLAEMRAWNEGSKIVTAFLVAEGGDYMLDGWGVHEHASSGPPYDAKAPVVCVACLRRLSGVR